MNTNISLSRIILLLKRDISENYKYILAISLTVLSVFTIFQTIDALSDSRPELATQQNNMYFSEMLIAGIFVAGMAFRDFRTKEKTMSYLTLPAQTIEKFISNWLYSGVIFMIIFTVLFGIFNLLNIFIVEYLTDYDISFFNPFTEDFVNFLKAYIPIHAVFLAGAAWFKRIPLFFTSFAIFIISLAIFFFVLAIGYMIFDNGTLAYTSTDKIISVEILKNFATYAIPPLFWFVAFLKIKEKEV